LLCGPRQFNRAVKLGRPVPGDQLLSLSWGVLGGQRADENAGKVNSGGGVLLFGKAGEMPLNKFGERGGRIEEGFQKKDDGEILIRQFS